MAEWKRVASVSEVPVGEGREFTVGERIVAVFNLDGAFHAVDGICLHAGGPVAQGKVTGCVVTCPWHGWQYDVTTGKHCLTPRLALDTFPVRVVDDAVEVEV